MNGFRIAFHLLAFCAANGSVFATDDQRPNVLLIMADDLGYSDLGCFGSEIETPQIDSIAENGLLFSHFRASPMCVTSRIALMSGMPMHCAGEHNYSNSVPLPIRMKRAGYRTMMTGKWHAGSPDPRSRDLFDRSFGFLGGATDSFVGGKDWFLNDKPFTDFGQGFYSTTAFADRSIQFMKEARSMNQPFFMYVAFNAPHHPCQAPQTTVEKYTSVYARGYESLRLERSESLKRLGLMEDNWQPAPLEDEVRRWGELSDFRRTVETQRMSAYAACIDEIDQSVGRLLQFLEDAGIADDTLVVFLSDNGGDYNNGSIKTDDRQIPWAPRTNPSSSNGWASVKCSPFRYYKHACHEGGIATPMVIRWPAGIRQPKGTKIAAATSITDLYPTVLEVAGISNDMGQSSNAHHFALDAPVGHSLVELFEAGGQRKPSPNFQWYRFSRAWVEGEWKAVSLYGGPWRLYDLKNDRCEVVDRATEEPERLSKMVDRWHEFAKRTGVPNSEPMAAETQRGWGWHRLEMSIPALTTVVPGNGAVSQSSDVELTLEFRRPIDFTNTAEKKIYLFDVSDEANPVWEADPDISHVAQSQRKIVFNDLPNLLPDHHYSVRWDAGWIRVGGRPAGPLNDGAYWWRFRTPKRHSVERTKTPL